MTDHKEFRYGYKQIPNDHLFKRSLYVVKLHGSLLTRHVYLFLLELITPCNGHLFSQKCEEKGKIVGCNIIPVITGNTFVVKTSGDCKGPSSMNKEKRS